MKTNIIAVCALIILTCSALADEIRGVVNRVEPDHARIVIEGRGRVGRRLEISFQVDKDTRIMLGSQTGNLADLKAGDRVRVSYELRDGERMALGISGRALSRKMDASPVDANFITGVLQRVSQADKEIVVIGPGANGEPEKETTLAIADNIPITRQDKSIKLADLKEGEQVTVRVDRKDGKTKALAVQAGAASTPRSPNTRVEKLRQLLKFADYLLQQAGNQNTEPGPP